MKKLLVLVLALFMVLTLAACGSKETETTEVENGNPILELDVRKAIAYAIDRDAIVAARDDGVTRPLYGFVPSGLVSEEEGDFRAAGGDLMEYNPEKSKEILAALGYTESKPLVVEYYYNQNNAHDLVAAVLKEQLKAVGIELQLKTADKLTFFADRDDNGNYQLCRGAMSADYNDSLTYLDMATSTFQTHQSWGDAHYDEMMLAAASMSGQERLDQLHAAEKYLVEETCQVIPLFEYGSAVLKNTSVTGDFDNMQGNSLFWFVKNEGKDSFTFAVGGEPDYLDPAIASDSIGSYVINNMFFPLFYLGPDGLVPAAAENCEVSEDGLTYTITLVDNYWSDGQKVTANDYVYGAKHALSLGGGDVSYLSWITDYIVGAAQYDGATSTDMPDLGIVALDDKTIQYSLVKPVPFFTSLLWGGVYYPLREDFAPMGDKTWAITPNYPMCGAFVPTSIDKASKIEFTKNEKWCWADKTGVDTITVRVMEDMDAQLIAFMNGEIDCATAVEAGVVSKMPELADNFSATGVINYYVQMNCFQPAE